MNMLGNNILIENGNFNVIGDVYWGNAGGYKGPSLITDITALDSGIYFAVDKVRGHIFGYDTQGNMLLRLAEMEIWMDTFNCRVQ